MTLTVLEFEANFVPLSIVRLAQVEEQIERLSASDYEGRVSWVVNDLVVRCSMAFGIFISQEIHFDNFVLSGGKVAQER